METHAAATAAAAAELSIYAGEGPARRIERAIEESPVVIFSRSACCMCHVMRRLLASVGVHPTVIHVEEGEAPGGMMPAIFIGGVAVGGIEGLMELHLSGRLVPRLREVGAFCG